MARTISQRVIYARERVQAAINKGSHIIIRRKFWENDVTNGITTYCTMCDMDAYGDSLYYECPTCFGTRYTSGFAAPQAVMGVIRDITVTVKNEKTGYLSTKQPVLNTGYLVPLQTNDLIVPVEYDNNGDIIWEGTRYQVISAKPVHLRFNEYKTFEDTVVGWEAPVTLLPENHYWYTVPLI